MDVIQQNSVFFISARYKVLLAFICVMQHMLRSYGARRTAKVLSQGFIHSCWIKCANLMSRKQYSQSIYVLWRQISSIDSLIKNIKKK